ncbi:hypothetical protein BJY04DRAFT_214764 [Aspergillus karnatakaensis]|uniref:uncharacterized protein n=1 Tax=Aspergillus karnatakaensis TaxID=1810916 RepID=UPI003CCDEBC0
MPATDERSILERFLADLPLDPSNYESHDPTEGQIFPHGHLTATGSCIFRYNSANFPLPPSTATSPITSRAGSVCGIFDSSIVSLPLSLPSSRARSRSPSPAKSNKQSETPKPEGILAELKKHHSEHKHGAPKLAAEDPVLEESDPEKESGDNTGEGNPSVIESSDTMGNRKGGKGKSPKGSPKPKPNKLPLAPPEAPVGAESATSPVKGDRVEPLVIRAPSARSSRAPSVVGLVGKEQPIPADVRSSSSRRTSRAPSMTGLVGQTQPVAVDAQSSGSRRSSQVPSTDGSWGEPQRQELLSRLEQLQISESATPSRAPSVRSIAPPDAPHAFSYTDRAPSVLDSRRNSLSDRDNDQSQQDGGGSGAATPVMMPRRGSDVAIDPHTSISPGDESGPPFTAPNWGTDSQAGGNANGNEPYGPVQVETPILVSRRGSAIPDQPSQRAPSRTGTATPANVSRRGPNATVKSQTNPQMYQACTATEVGPTAPSSKTQSASSFQQPERAPSRTGTTTPIAMSRRGSNATAKSRADDRSSGVEPQPPVSGSRRESFAGGRQVEREPSLHGDSIQEEMPRRGSNATINSRMSQPHAPQGSGTPIVSRRGSNATVQSQSQRPDAPQETRTPSMSRRGSQSSQQPYSREPSHHGGDTPRAMSRQISDVSVQQAPSLNTSYQKSEIPGGSATSLMGSRRVSEASVPPQYSFHPPPISRPVATSHGAYQAPTSLQMPAQGPRSGPHNSYGGYQAGPPRSTPQQFTNPRPAPIPMQRPALSKDEQKRLEKAVLKGKGRIEKDIKAAGMGHVLPYMHAASRGSSSVGQPYPQQPYPQQTYPQQPYPQQPYHQQPYPQQPPSDIHPAYRKDCMADYHPLPRESQINETGSAPKPLSKVGLPVNLRGGHRDGSPSIAASRDPSEESRGRSGYEQRSNLRREPRLELISENHICTTKFFMCDKCLETRRKVSPSVEGHLLNYKPRTQPVIISCSFFGSMDDAFDYADAFTKKLQKLFIGDIMVNAAARRAERHHHSAGNWYNVTALEPFKGHYSGTPHEIKDLMFFWGWMKKNKDPRRKEFKKKDLERDLSFLVDVPFPCNPNGELRWVFEKSLPKDLTLEEIIYSPSHHALHRQRWWKKTHPMQPKRRRSHGH